MIIAPHRTFAIGHFLAAVEIIPAIWPMINGMKEQALMFWIGRKVRLLQKGVENGQAGGAIVIPGFWAHIASQAQETLRGDGGGRTIDRFPLVVRISRFLQVITEAPEI